MKEVSNATATTIEDQILSYEEQVKRTVVYKYPVKYGENTLLVTERNQVIKFGLDPANELCLWIAIDPNKAETVTLSVSVVFTGEEFDNEKYPHYIGSLTRTGLVYHCFYNV